MNDRPIPTPQEHQALGFRTFLKQGDSFLPFIKVVLVYLYECGERKIVKKEGEKTFFTIQSPDFAGWQIINHENTPIELRLHGVLVAQSNNSRNWSVAEYINESGTNCRIEI